MPEPVLDLTVHLEHIIRLIDESTVAEELLLRPAGGGCLIEQAARASVDMAWVTDYALTVAGAVIEHRTVPLHVNVTPADLADPSFIAIVEHAITSSGLSQLVLEITEHTELVPSSQLERTLLALRRRGVRFAIDDFGDRWAGEASVDAVRPEIIKVCLPRLREPATGSTVVATIRAAAVRHHAQVVVEQVETAHDLAEVRALGFSHAQGWFWADRPPVGARRI